MLFLLKKMITNSIPYLFDNVQRHQPDGHNRDGTTYGHKIRKLNRMSIKQTHTKQTEE
jgi:hypothetical protein